MQNGVTSTKSPSISTNYTGSTVQKFDFKSTYLGCALPTQASAGAPETCTITFVGIEAVGGASVSKDCTYSGTVEDPALVECDFGKALSGVKEV